MGKPISDLSAYSLDEEAKAPQPKKRNRSEAKNIREVKDIVANIIAGNLNDFEADMKAIKDPKERCDIMLKLMNFVLPKVSTVDVNGTMEFDPVTDEVAKLAQQTGVMVTGLAAKTSTSS